MKHEEVCIDIRSFAEMVCKAVSENLGDEYEVKLQEVTKNNGVILQGLVILSKRQNISPTIYLNSFLEAYEAGVPINRLVARILEIYREDLPENVADMSFFREFEKVKDRICYRIVNRDKNRRLLERIPHMDFLNLSICFFYAYQNKELGDGSILIYNNHLDMWGCSVPELFRLAQENTPLLFPWELHSMEEILKELLEDSGDVSLEKELGEASEDEPMWVLTNAKKVHGAACVAYPKLLAKLAEQMEDDLYVLPCSVHEVILLPRKSVLEEEHLRDMIREINATQLEPEEVLSDDLYFYDRSKKELTIRL